MPTKRAAALLISAALIATGCSRGPAQPIVTGPPPTPVPPASPAAISAPPPADITTRPPRPPVRLTELELWAFPGPDHYAGDLLTFQLPIGGFATPALVAASIAIDGDVLETEGELRRDPLLGDMVVFKDAFDTSGAVGGHWAQVTARLEPEASIEATLRFVVRPPQGRPAQERTARWSVVELDCCAVTYLEGTAAARDLDQLVEMIEDSAGRVEEYFGLTLEGVDFVLIDTLWGNGGYAGEEVVVSYLDRGFGPGRGENIRFTVLHELAHAATDQIDSGTPWPLKEGVAVQFTGGHFKAEPLGARARALDLQGGLPGLVDLFDGFPELQHESRYVAVGAFVEYLVSEYGRAAVLDLYDSRIEAEGSVWLAEAADEVLGIELNDLQRRFTEWVAGHDASDQSADLALSVALQEARRGFQAKYAPYPNFFVYPSVTESGQPALAMRDARTPRLTAVEALIGHAQVLLIGGDLDAAAPVVAEIERIVAEGTVGVDASREFLEVAEALAAAGYELLEYVPGSPTAVATRRAPELSVVEVAFDEAGWRVREAEGDAG